MTVTTTNPATGEHIADYQLLTKQGVSSILDAGVSAQRDWAATTLTHRASLLRSTAAILRRDVETHAMLITEEMGKPITEARAEVTKCALAFDYYAEHLEELLAPRTIPTEASQSFVRYDPLGVVLAIMPWNYPYWQVARFAAPALAVGNGALLKHAVNVTGSAFAFADVLREAGFPDDLFAVLVVDHDQIDSVIRDSRVAAVTLTGSERAGAAVGASAGTALKKAVLELGGSDPFVVLADADVDALIEQAVRARFVNSGQSCLCAKRFIVERPLAEQFEDKISAAVAALEVGDPTKDSTRIGPLAKPSFVADLHRQVQESVGAGARLLVGGRALDEPGSFYAPTVLADVTPQMAAFQEETFGPVLAITPADDAEHAISLADDSPYGLAASVWTSDVDRGLNLGGRIRSGALFINQVPASDPRLPFGGVKNSGYGRELSVEGLREFANTRTVVVG